MSEAARVIDYDDYGIDSNIDYYGSAAPAIPPIVRPRPEIDDTPIPREQTKPKTAKKTMQAEPGISVFAIFGTVLSAFLMLFVIIGQIKYNAIASETARLGVQLDSLYAQQKKLETEFENSIDMKEIERIARDNLGMSRPVTEQVAIVINIPIDNAQILNKDSNSNKASGIIQSILDWIKN